MNQRHYLRPSGRKKQALDVLGKLDAFAKVRYVSPMEFAWIHFALEQTDPSKIMRQSHGDVGADLVQNIACRNLAAWIKR